MKIRLADPDDARAIAGVHVHAWKTTYKGMVPESYLQKLSLERRSAGLRDELSRLGRETCYLVAETDDGEVIGFAAFGTSREPDLEFDGELYAIYVLQEHQRKGVGKALFGAVVDWMIRQGYGSMCLWVLTENPAGAFYEAMGGTILTNRDIEICGAVLDETCYGWSNLRSSERPSD